MSATTPDELLGMLRRLLEQEFEIPAQEITPEAQLLEDLDLDSVDAVTLAVCLEEETGLGFSEDELGSLDTVASVVALVHRRLQGLASATS
ncbi:MAG: acyl carrier protein [Myxococcota bacterium]